MKAILVVDMPKSCEDCELCRDGYLCLRLGEVDESVENGIKDLRCPLKPMPSKRVPDGKETDQIYGCYVGWNACIDEILGEENG